MPGPAPEPVISESLSHHPLRGNPAIVCGGTQQPDRPHTVELDGQPYTMSRDKEEIKKAFNQVRYRAGLPGLTANQLNSTPEVQNR